MQLAPKMIRENPPYPRHLCSIHRDFTQLTRPDVRLPEFTLDDLLALPSTGSQKHPHKDVLRITVEPNGEPETVYIKRQWAWDRRWPRWSDWRDGVARLSDPVLEWRGLRALADIGLNVPQPMRLLTDGIPRSPRAAIVMSAVPVKHSLADLARRGDLLRLNPFARRSLAVTLMQTVDCLHRHGFRWRSMKAKHIYPQRLDDQGWRLWLIDCEGIRPRATRRQQTRDRHLLLRSLQTSGADAAFVEMVDGMCDAGSPIGDFKYEI
jgi:hypothetical protein